jgi:hypothetical protein
MADTRNAWCWEADPTPGEPGLVLRAVTTERQPRLTYRRTMWLLVRDVSSVDAAGQPTTSYHLTFGALLLPGFPLAAASGLFGAIWAEPHIVQETQLKRAVEPLSVSADSAAETEAAVEALLDRAAEEIDRVLG